MKSLIVALTVIVLSTPAFAQVSLEAKQAIQSASAKSESTVFFSKDSIKTVTYSEKETSCEEVLQDINTLTGEIANLQSKKDQLEKTANDANCG